MSSGCNATRQSTRSGAVGSRFGNLFHLPSAPVLVARQVRMAHLAVTEIRADDPIVGMTDSIQVEDAFLLGLMFRDIPDHEVWEDGHPLPRRTITAGQFYLRDLKREQAALIEHPHHALHFYLPRAALNAIADESEAPRIGGLWYRPGEPLRDPVVWNLGSSLLPAFRESALTNPLFIEHVVVALGAHVAQVYGGMSPGGRQRGGLAKWQETRAKELLSSNLQGDTSLHEIANVCGLSVSHFSRAFKWATGVAPYQWLMLRRIDVAKGMLADPRLSLAEIALACGFCDQSHFTRVFGMSCGLTPGAWRRNLGIGHKVSSERRANSPE
ncbi:MAG: helix-turn-helix transcriptional regulator [Haliea sp.]|nr:helix-turn-helix transcriptional regulator [Haliea sp.]